jgi:hypothetical protein
VEQKTYPIRRSGHMKAAVKVALEGRLMPKNRSRASSTNSIRMTKHWFAQCAKRYASGSLRRTSWFMTITISSSSDTVRANAADCIVSIAAGANGVGLFYRGATLPDPHKMLLGSGNQNRFIRIESAGRWFGPRLKHSSLLLSRKPSPLCQLAEREGSSFALFLQGRGRAVSQRTSSR